MIDYDVDDFLAHYGKKGMKWGVRTKHTESRKEFKARAKKEQGEYHEKKANDMLSLAFKGGNNVLLATKFSGDQHGSIITGKEFVNQMSKSRAFDVRLTEVYAIKGASGMYESSVLYPAFKKPERR